MALIVAVVVFCGLFGGALLGMMTARSLQEHHLSDRSQEAVKLGVGMVAAMTSLILGLMTASVKQTFDTTSRDVQQFATYLVTLDTALRLYGPDASTAQAALAAYTRQTIDERWPAAPRPGQAEDNALGSETLMIRVGTAIRALKPAAAEQVDLRAEALDRFKMLSSLRWTVMTESVTTVSPVFIMVLIIWMTLIFFSFGLFAPPNAVPLIAFLLCAACLAAALFIILEMGAPFGGLMTVPKDPMVRALAHMQS